MGRKAESVRRGLQYGLTALVAVALLVLALANRGGVELRLLPPEAGAFLGWDWTLRLPLFLVILGAVLVGVGVGFLWEWARESKHRRSASLHKREAKALKSEMAGLRRETNRPKDEVLALLEKAPARR